MTAELVILTPLLILFLLLVVAFGRIGGTRIDIDGAANEAARAASTARDAGGADREASATAASALAGDHIGCAHLNVAVDTSAFHPGGSVAVTVSCAVALKDVTGLRLPTDKVLSATAVAPVDRYRGVGQ